MNLPNKLTLLRIIMAIVVMIFLMSDITHHYLIACVIFVIASITDSIDGHIARSRNMITDFGKLMDPLADKMLVAAALIGFVAQGCCNAWILFIFIIREFAVTSLRLVITSNNGKVIAANIWGKAKTISQMVAIIVVFLIQWIKELVQLGIISPELDIIRNYQIQAVPWFDYIGAVALWISAILTIVSGVIYFVQNKEVFKQMK